MKMETRYTTSQEKKLWHLSVFGILVKTPQEKTSRPWKKIWTLVPYDKWSKKTTGEFLLKSLMVALHPS